MKNLSDCAMVRPTHLRATTRPPSNATAVRNSPRHFRAPKKRAKRWEKKASITEKKEIQRKKEREKKSISSVCILDVWVAMGGFIVLLFTRKKSRKTQDSPIQVSFALKN